MHFIEYYIFGINETKDPLGFNIQNTPLTTVLSKIV